MATKKKQKHTVKVNRQFLLDLANTIYDRSTRKYLRLCSGTLQNGPDPNDGARSMHCGLGELYFAMTGRQPKQDRVEEDNVIDLAVELSPIYVDVDKARHQVVQAINNLGLSSNVKEELIDMVGGYDDEDLLNENEAEFRKILDNIPTVNDKVIDLGAVQRGGTTCDVNTSRTQAGIYRERAKVVADALRAAAALLPS